MNIFYCELKKLINSNILWGFLGICIIFNCFIIISDARGDSYVDFVIKTAEKTGYVLNENFTKALSAVTTQDEMEKQYLSNLQIETDNVVDSLDEYDTSYIAEAYIKTLKLDGRLADIMRSKYIKLQQSVDTLAKDDSSLTLYFAGSTYAQHRLLFDNVMRWISMEGILFASLVVLFSLGYEELNKTEALTSSSKTGRYLVRHKLLASICMGLGGYILCSAVSLLVYFTQYDYSAIWQSSVSSTFNYINDVVAGARPFLTWGNFSIIEYLMAIILTSAGLILCFILLSFIIGLIVRHTYVGFMILIIMSAAFLILPMNIHNINLLFFILVLSPTSLWYKQFLWFTDGGMDILWPHFEITGIGAYFILFLILAIVAEKAFRKRDLK